MMSIRSLAESMEVPLGGRRWQVGTDHPRHPGPELPSDTTSEGWGLLTGHQRGPHLATSGYFLMATDKHCCRDVIRGRLRYCRGSAVEYEQPRPGDLARERFAVADRKERVAATVHHQRWHRELSQSLAPARPAVELGEHHAQLVGHLHRGRRARR